MSEQHNLYARLIDGTVVQIGHAAGWADAQNRWARLDNARLARINRAIPYLPGLGPVSYYAVRSDSDPTWSAAHVRPVSAVRYRRTRAIPRPHSVEVFTDRRFRATPPHCAMLRTRDALVIGYGRTESHAIHDARGRAEIAGVI